MKKHNARPIQTVLGSFVHIPLFILMAYSARDMIRSGNYEGMDVGGFWIWSNLLEADETFLLPFLATSSTYLNLELSLRNRSDLWTWFGRKLQFLPILGFPLYASLPQVTESCFIYICLSTILSSLTPFTDPPLL
jgi:YidC/Oxa1 family membrane protein insertase